MPAHVIAVARAAGHPISKQATGLRNPSAQIDAFRRGLLAAMCERSVDGKAIRKAGIMTTVLAGGRVRAGDAIAADWPDPPFRPLDRV